MTDTFHRGSRVGFKVRRGHRWTLGTITHLEDGGLAAIVRGDDGKRRFIFTKNLTSADAVVALHLAGAEPPVQPSLEHTTHEDAI